MVFLFLEIVFVTPRSSAINYINEMTELMSDDLGRNYCYNSNILWYNTLVNIKYLVYLMLEST